MTETLAPVPAAPIRVITGALQPKNLSELVTLAQVMARSGMVPKQYVNNPDAIIVALQMGAEVGLSPMASVQNIAVINGRPSIWGDALLGLALAHPDCEDVNETLSEDGATATCTVKRRGRSPVIRTFNVEDAKKAGLWGKAGPWTNYPKRMLQMRARGFAVRDAFPDALRGLKVAEESADLPAPVQPLLESDFAEVAPVATAAPEVVEPEPVDPAALNSLCRAVADAAIARDVAARFGAPAGWMAHEKEIEEMIRLSNMAQS